ncbi:hypothetical protein GF354_05495 [Candidatus Peregrinibacteria bacterium]|nr:hypothetical protein [Candidatus Peregrinibacteria bacterium]
MTGAEKILNAENYNQFDWYPKELIKLAKVEPEVFVEDTYKLPETFNNPNVPLYKTIREINDLNISLLNKRVGIMAIKEILTGELKLEDLKNLENNELSEELITKLRKIQNSADKDTRLNVDRAIEKAILHHVKKVNENHNESESIRFREIEKMDSNTLYSMIVFGKDDLYTSSFNGIYKNLKNKLQENGVSNYELLKENNFLGLKKLLETLASYNKMDEFLENMSTEEKQKVLDMYIGEISVITESAAIGEIIVKMKNDPIIKIIEKSVKKAYEKNKNKENKAVIFAALGSLIGKESPLAGSWAKEMANNYKIENKDLVKNEELMNEDGSCVQQYFFYNDTKEKNRTNWDGHLSFKNMLKKYGFGVSWDKDGNITEFSGSNPDYKLEDFGTFIKITNKKNNGKTLEIYANKPDHEDEGVEDIKRELRKNNKKVNIAVHRGHSYYTKKTIKRLPEEAKIVHLGSCGGYGYLDEVLVKNPDAQVISTKGTGTRRINDPLMKSLNEKILAGENIDWDKFWKDLSERKSGRGIKIKKDANFKNYIPPNGNIGAKLVSLYYKNYTPETKVASVDEDWDNLEL